jgi:methionine synthase II (cobalamin-independent)
MPARIKTTTVGSYPVPIWPTGSMSRQVLRDAVMAVLKTQEAVFDYNDSNNLFY